MKQNGVRLVQRKFAQGVPIPASISSAAPLPPERKPDTTYPPRNVYHNNMSARSLLDIVSMQNIHKHKQQPLVVLERLRADEIPPPPVQKVRVRLRKQRANKNNMCLRSGKRKSPDAAKSSVRKRKKLSSDSTDDVPLMYYFNRPSQAKPHPVIKAKDTVKKDRLIRKEKRTQAPKKKERATRLSSDKNASSRAESTVSEKSDDFTFKEPSSPARLSYQLFKKRMATANTGRPLKKAGLAKPGARWASLRSARAPSAARAPSVVRDPRPLRNTAARVMKPPTPALRKGLRKVSKDDQPSAAKPPGPKALRSAAATPLSLLPDAQPSEARPTTSKVLKSPLAESNDQPSSAKPPGPKALRSAAAMSLSLLPDAQPSSAKPPGPKVLKSQPAENKVLPPLPSTSKASKVAPVVSKPAAQPPAPSAADVSAVGCGPPPSPAPSFDIEKRSNVPQAPSCKRDPPADVYEFDAELEATRPPSGLWRRNQPPSDPTSPATVPATIPATVAAPVTAPVPAPVPVPATIQYVDILPDSSHCVCVTPTKGQENENEYLSLSLVPKEEINIKKKNLIENLSNSPALLNKFFNCLTAEMQNELDNLITAEGLHNNQSTSTNGAPSYLDQKAGSVLDAPIFYPSHDEFQDPIEYYHKITPLASRYGLCKIVPPTGFKPPCNMNESIRFAVIYQYISKMYNRWGPVSRELAAIKAHLWSQSVVFTRPPLLDGSEVNLPKLYHAIERNGGLSAVIKRNRWGRVADEMKLSKLQNPEKKLDPIYMRYLLPYAVLSDQERQNIMAKVENSWTTKYQKMLERARNPFQRQNRMMGTESESDDDGDDGNTAALLEAEDCIVQGRIMNLVTFKKIATSLMDANFEPNKQPPSAADVEKAYYKAVLLGTEHIVANTASIDTGEEGYGFPKDPESEYGTHPWNLKVLARNPNNVLRYLGPVLGVTVPTLHLSMLFSTSCWHRDPHGLPWTEYMHSGAEKIWYGIPRDESANFRRAVETLCPAYCQNKPIWLASEITMVPPDILSEHGVKLSKLTQLPGEYVVVFPEAHSCSITTGFGISESVYFASNAWLKDVYKLFQELRNSCEPTMFSLEQLLINGSADPAAPPRVCAVLCTLLGAELDHRRALERKGLKVQERPPSSAPLNTSYFRTWNTRDQDECEYCRSTLFLSKVTGLTGRKSAVCPEHALRLLETKKFKTVNLSELEFLSSYTTSALEEMLERLEPRAEEGESDGRAPSETSVIDLTDEQTCKGAAS